MSLSSRLGQLGAFLKAHQHSIKITFEGFKLLKDFIESPGIATTGQLFFGAISAYNDHTATNRDIFDKNWEIAFDKAFSPAICTALVGYPKTPLPAPEGTEAHIVDVDGTKVGIHKSSATHTLVYLEKRSIDVNRVRVAKILRKAFPGNLVLEEKQGSFWGDTWFDVSQDSGDVWHTNRTIEYGKEIKQYLDIGINRSIMFYGPPGTGKSVVTRAIVEYLGFKSIRIRPIVSLSSGVNATSLEEAVKLFSPDAFIIDDFDRTLHQTMFLEALEYLNRSVKLLMVTVNNTDSFDVALKRPQRFDLIREVLTLEPDTVKKILGDDLAFFDQVKEWPVTYVVEFAKRRKVNKDPKKAKEWIAELTERQRPPGEPKRRRPKSALDVKPHKETSGKARKGNKADS